VYSFYRDLGRFEEMPTRALAELLSISSVLINLGLHYRSWDRFDDDERMLKLALLGYPKNSNRPREESARASEKFLTRRLAEPKNAFADAQVGYSP
jgi:hypothetical protein